MDDVKCATPIAEKESRLRSGLTNLTETANILGERLSLILGDINPTVAPCNNKMVPVPAGVQVSLYGPSLLEKWLDDDITKVDDIKLILNSILDRLRV